MNNFYKSKNVLVTGGTGLIGQPLCELLKEQEANVTVVSLDGESRAPNDVKYIKSDLRNFQNCIEVCENQDVVFHLAGVKGSPKMTAERPASFFVPTIQFSINMMEAARRQGVKNYLFTSSIGVYEPADIFVEESVWKTQPSHNDRFAGWAKRISELQAEAYMQEYNWKGISIVRPANVYGPFDNFDPENAMVIPSLINRALNTDGPLEVWGDGSPVRDFIHARDVARGMMLMVEKGVNEPVNLGSGSGVTIKEIASAIALKLDKEIIWDKTKPMGDAMRLMSTKKAESYGFKANIPLIDGISETIEWFKKNQDIASDRYNSFTERELQPISK